MVLLDWYIDWRTAFCLPAFEMLCRDLDTFVPIESTRQGWNLRAGHGTGSEMMCNLPVAAGPAMKLRSRSSRH